MKRIWKRRETRLIEEITISQVTGLKGETMETGIFYVKLRSDLEKDFKDFFPHMSANYITMSHMFQKDKPYPVLAVEKVIVFDQEGRETASARFLVPTENRNFSWVHSEIFQFAGLEDDVENNRKRD